MTWKSKFSGIVALMMLVMFSCFSAAAQKVTIRKSATGRVLSKSETREYRGNLSSDENEIYNLVNDERQKKGLYALEWDDELAKLARAYSKKMAKESFFSHYDRDGNSVVERARDADITGWNRIGENLFFCEGYGEFDLLAVRGWMNSTDHRRNILDRQFNTTGIGIAQSRDGRTYITQVFTKS